MARGAKTDFVNVTCNNWRQVDLNQSSRHELWIKYTVTFALAGGQDRRCPQAPATVHTTETRALWHGGRAFDLRSTRLASVPVGSSISS